MFHELLELRFNSCKCSLLYVSRPCQSYKLRDSGGGATLNSIRNILFKLRYCPRYSNPYYPWFHLCRAAAPCWQSSPPPVFVNQTRLLLLLLLFLLVRLMLWAKEKEKKLGRKNKLGCWCHCISDGKRRERRKEGRARESRAGSVKPCKVQGRVLPTRRRRRREECVGRGRKEFCVSNL